MEQLFNKQLERKLEKAGIIAVLVIDEPEDAVPLAQALLNNGISAIELTLRTETAINSLKMIVKELPEMTAGVGTIIFPDQVDKVKKTGALFGVAPGYNPDIVKRCHKSNLSFAPGISIPSEIERAVNQGCRVFKYFHAEGMGGVKYLRGINGPYEFLGLKYIPLGGLNKNNMYTYLEFPHVLAIGGSWIAPRNLIQKKDWATISRNANEAAQIFKDVRG